MAVGTISLSPDAAPFRAVTQCLLAQAHFISHVDAILERHGESSHQNMLYAPLNDGLNELNLGIDVVPPDTIIKPGSILPNLGNVRLNRRADESAFPIPLLRWLPETEPATGGLT